MLYGLAWAALERFARGHGVPVVETQAGKSSLPWDHPLNLGAIGVTGSPAANDAARQADLVIAIGSRLQDFTTGSRSLFAAPVLGINVQALDAHKCGGSTLVADARLALEALACRAWVIGRPTLAGARPASDAPTSWRQRVRHADIGGTHHRRIAV